MMKKINIHKILKSKSNSLFGFSKFNFADKVKKAIKDKDDNSGLTNTLVQTLQNELTSLESSYSAPDQNERDAYLNTNKWVLFDKDNTSSIELKKSEGEFDISIRFSSKPAEALDNNKDPSGR